MTARAWNSGVRPIVAVALLLVMLAAGIAGARVAGASDSTAAATPERHGSVALEPGYYPPADPESSSDRIGRRLNAPLVSKRFAGGARSLDELGRQVCHALHVDVPESLLSLGVREDEFRDILWREFPQSRPATGAQWQDGWMFLWARLHGGSVSAMNEYGGHAYEFLRFERTDSTHHFRNFNLIHGLVLVARDDEGNIQRFTWIRTAVERKGRYKIYSMKD
jgi:hypothetical protein